jgi:hypothetical protein
MLPLVPGLSLSYQERISFTFGVSCMARVLSCAARIRRDGGTDGWFAGVRSFVRTSGAGI